VRRARLDDAKDREIQDFVHAVSGHVSLGRPFGDAVERVARDVDLGPLNGDVADLSFNLGMTTHDDDVRAAALDRFVERVDTQLAAQTVGLVSGALDAGSDADAAFEALQAEVGRLYHEKRALRSRLLVYVAVGWTTAVLVVGITVAVNLSVLDSFAQLSSVSNAASTGGLTIDPTAVDIERDRYRFYLVTQATMLACGWFAGAASRGRYDALLHSGLQSRSPTPSSRGWGCCDPGAVERRRRRHPARGDRRRARDVDRERRDGRRPARGGSDSRRVAADLDGALAPVETTGVRRGELSFTSGDLDLLARDVRVLDSGGVVARVEANALRFSAGERGATYLAGSVVTHGPEWSQTRTAVPLSADPRVLVVSVPALRGDVSLAASGGASYTPARTSPTTAGRSAESYRVAVETTHPAAFERQFERLNATVTTGDVDGDGIDSVVADFPGVRTAYLVVHETEVSVS